jgi:hypothetical protein
MRILTDGNGKTEISNSFSPGNTDGNTDGGDTDAASCILTFAEPEFLAGHAIQRAYTQRGRYA